MAKRKRLTPARDDFLGAAPYLSGKPAAPIAQVVADAASAAALSEVSSTLAAARAEGRMIELLPLEAIDASYLVRDRLGQTEGDDMEALLASLRARGQQTPIEVVALPPGKGGYSHGLISGWRRLAAMRRLSSGTGEPQFARIKALVITPETAQDAYVAMVEENEIRVDLSHYERARIVVRALQEGVYATQKQALNGLFGNVARAKRSKIGTFMQLVDAFDSTLLFPAAISEKLGLSLAREMAGDPAFAAEVSALLTSTPRPTPAEEVAVLNRALTDRRSRPVAGASSKQKNAAQGIATGLAMRFVPEAGRIEITGPSVSKALARDLEAWLRSR